MQFINLENTSQLDEVFSRSHNKTQIIFKHSTRCSISLMVMNRLIKNNVEVNADFHYLDLIRYRDLSNLIADKCDVVHESPQVLIIKNGSCIYDASHTAISMDDIATNM